LLCGVCASLARTTASDGSRFVDFQLCSF
jgi:hypothetical protein